MRAKHANTYFCRHNFHLPDNTQKCPMYIYPIDCYFSKKTPNIRANRPCFHMPYDQGIKGMPGVYMKCVPHRLCGDLILIWWERQIAGMYKC